MSQPNPYCGGLFRLYLKLLLWRTNSGEWGNSYLGRMGVLLCKIKQHHILDSGFRPLSLKTLAAFASMKRIFSFLYLRQNTLTTSAGARIIISEPYEAHG